MKLPIPILAAAALALALPLRAAAVTTYYHVIPYKDRTQNPFWQGVLDGTVYLEDFEDHELNTPFVKGDYGQVGGKTYRNIDGDDGNIDGQTLGYAWSSTAPASGINTYFAWTPNGSGELPKYVGAAAFFGSLTGNSTTIYYDQILAYDANGVLVITHNFHLWNIAFLCKIGCTT